MFLNIKDFVNGDGEDEEIKKIEKKGFKKRVLNNKKTKKLAFDDWIINI